MTCRLQSNDDQLKIESPRIQQLLSPETLSVPDGLLNVLTGLGKDCKEERTLSSFFHCTYISFQQNLLLILKVFLPASKSGLKARFCFLPQDLWHRCVLYFWIIIHSRCSQVDTKDSHHIIQQSGLQNQNYLLREGIDVQQKCLKW